MTPSDASGCLDSVVGSLGEAHGYFCCWNIPYLLQGDFHEIIDVSTAT
jgi:hypothetical protein